MKNHFVWADQIGETKNANDWFLLTISLDENEQADIEISASGTYTLFLNGQATLHGPLRNPSRPFRPAPQTRRLCRHGQTEYHSRTFGAGNRPFGLRRSRASPFGSERYFLRHGRTLPNALGNGGRLRQLQSRYRRLRRVSYPARPDGI